MNSNVMTHGGRRVRVAAATAAAMFGLCLAVAPVANAIPAPDPPPSGGGPGWESLAENCYNGSVRACARLADQPAAVDAPVYHDYGFSCGGRVNYDSTSAADEDVGCGDPNPGNSGGYQP